MRCRRGNSAEEERDTAKSSVADRRPWNLGETRHNGFEGEQISTFQRGNSLLPPQHHRLFVVSANSTTAVTLCGV